MPLTEPPSPNWFNCPKCATSGTDEHREDKRCARCDGFGWVRR